MGKQRETGGATAGQAAGRRDFLVFAGVSLGAVVLGPGCADDVAAGATDTGPGVLVPDVGNFDVTADTTTDATQVDLSPVDVGPDIESEVSADLASDDFGQPPEPERLDPSAFELAGEMVFPLGVSSGDPLVDRVVFKTRCLGRKRVELIVLGEVGDDDRAIVLARENVTIGSSDMIHVDVAGLPPGTRGRFLFVHDGKRSPIGHFATAAAPFSRPVVRFGASSCSRHEFGPFRVLERAAGDDLDFFVLLGDTVYADGSRTVDDFRASWRQNLATPGYLQLFQAFPHIATWDDHEVDNDWNPETIAAPKLEAARETMFDHLAIRRNSSDPTRIWRSFVFGDTLELFVLDCRSERRPSTRQTDAPQYISEAQLAWLADGLKKSRALFKVVANTVPVTDWPVFYPGASDRWQGYAAQRSRVLESCRRVPGVVWLAGDFHFAAVARIDPPSGVAHELTEVLVGPVAHVNPGLSIVETFGSREQFSYLSAARNYGRIIADPTAARPRLSVEHVGEDGRVLNTTVLLQL